MLRLMLLLCLVVSLGCSQEGQSIQQAGTSGAAEAEAVALDVTPVSFEAGQTVTVHVPDMHCMFVCYPKVKETLAAQEAIDADSIALVEQEDEGAINDPRIQVTLKSDMEDKSLLAALASVGFDKATITTAAVE